MAQEDNNLNARMAVASTRDSSSMKALAVITAIFLPGEYIGTLFGVSMFNWEYDTAGDPSLSEDAAKGWPRPIVMPSFWIYWTFTIPLTLFIVSIWRAWWVNQDRYFRRHLSIELSNERYWTTDGRPRDLETSFLQDFFSLFRKSGAASTANVSIVGSRKRTFSAESDRPEPAKPTAQDPGFLRRAWTMSQSTAADKDGTDTPTPGPGARNTLGMPRFRQVSFARDPRPQGGTSAV
jgi:hypothetical protein